MEPLLDQISRLTARRIFAPTSDLSPRAHDSPRGAGIRSRNRLFPRGGPCHICLYCRRLRLSLQLPSLLAREFWGETYFEEGCARGAFGWKIGQVRAEQPTTAYGDFKHEIINEIARPLQMPFNVAAGNSSGYNYVSGRLDHQRGVRVLSRLVLSEKIA